MVRSFGQVLIAAGGTPVRATLNEQDPTAPVPLEKVRIQVRPSNAGILYVFYGGANFSGDHRTDRVGCIAILPVPASATAGPFAALEIGVEVVPVGLYLQDIWLDGTSGDGAIIAGVGV